MTETGSNVSVEVKNRENNEEENIEADYVLVSTGRKPYIENLFSDRIDIEKTENGFIKTDSHLRTNLEGIWAIGDVVEGPMLAHKAEEEGIAVAELIACLLYTSPSPRDTIRSRMPSSA